MTLTKVLGALLVIGAAIGVNWKELPLPALVLDGVVLALGAGLVVWAEYFERTHPGLFPKTPKEEEDE